jgi:hypothetical protein
MTLDDIRRLNIREAGNWPLLPKIMILGVLFFLILVAGALTGGQIKALTNQTRKLKVPRPEQGSTSTCTCSSSRKSSNHSVRC